MDGWSTLLIPIGNPKSKVDSMSGNILHVVSTDFETDVCDFVILILRSRRSWTRWLLSNMICLRSGTSTGMPYSNV